MQIVDIREIVAPQSKDGTNLFTMKDNEAECCECSILIPATTSTGSPKYESQFYDIRRQYQNSYSNYNQEVKKKIDSFILNNVYVTIKNDNDIKELQLPQAYEEELFSCLDNNQRAITATHSVLSANGYNSGFVLTGTTTSFEKLVIMCRFHGTLVHYQIADVVLSSYLDEINDERLLRSLYERTKDSKITKSVSYIEGVSTKQILGLTKFIFNSYFCEVL